MELKRYLEIDSKTALEKIKSEHGEEALIISSDKVGNKRADSFMRFPV